MNLVYTNTCIQVHVVYKYISIQVHKCIQVHVVLITTRIKFAQDNYYL